MDSGPPIIESYDVRCPFCGSVLYEVRGRCRTCARDLRRPDALGRPGVAGVARIIPSDPRHARPQ